MFLVTQQQVRLTTLVTLLSATLLISPIALAEKTTTPSEGTNTVDLPLQDIQRFATVVSQIKRYYVEPIEDKKLFSYAISGMLSSLDPHSDYLDEKALKDLEVATTGKFSGIGIEVMPEGGVIKVVSPIEDSPAYKAGIKAGDLVVRINGKFVGNMTLNEAVSLIRGKRGTTVNLTIVRKSEKKPLEFEVKREVLTSKTVKSELLGDGYAYVRITLFQNETRRDLYNTLKALKTDSNIPLKGVILDLRNNPGGLLDSSIDVTNMFLDSKNLRYKGLIVYTKGHVPGGDIEAKASGTDILDGLPMIVLINEGSASASEIVAGALQDQKRATVVGEKSFGKGSVQTVLPIDYDTAIKLTTALYYTPAGRSIQATGIVPDIFLASMSIPKDEDSSISLLSITEADLQKHLDNGNTPKKEITEETKKEEKSKEDKERLAKEKSNELLHSDFQLYEALNVLKGLHAFSQFNKK
ncbi:MAG: ctpB [Gammaproteobacteria bacterium]|nr:ctpB [Gammaproteobacteria bacterium]